MRHALFGIIAALIVIGAGVWLLGRDGGTLSVPTGEMGSDTNGASFDAVAEATTTATTTPERIVSYIDAGFDPKTLTVNAGETVRFENNGAYDLQVFTDAITRGATTTMPEGCDENVLAGCEPVSPGDSWSYTFSSPGTLGYHNNIDPTRTGTVRVR